MMIMNNDWSICLWFSDPDGDLIREAYNEGGNADYKYYYSNPHSIALNMEKVFHQFSEGADKSSDPVSAQIEAPEEDGHTEL